MIGLNFVFSVPMKELHDNVSPRRGSALIHVLFIAGRQRGAQVTLHGHLRYDSVLSSFTPGFSTHSQRHPATSGTQSVYRNQ